MCICVHLSRLSNTEEGNPLCFISFSTHCFPADYSHFIISTHYLHFFPFSSLILFQVFVFGPLSLDNLFLSSCAAFLALFASVFLGLLSHSVSYLFVSLPVCLCVFRPVSPLCSSLSPSWVSLSFSFPFTWSLSAVLGIPSVSCYSGWLCFHPVAYQHDLRFIFLCMRVCVYGHMLVHLCVRACLAPAKRDIKKTTLSKLQTQTQHFLLPDKALCFTSTFHCLHHLHIISI